MCSACLFLCYNFKQNIAGLVTQAFLLQARSNAATINSGFWILDSGFWILDSGLNLISIKILALQASWVNGINNP
jgi:hypothetical protein